MKRIAFLAPILLLGCAQYAWHKPGSTEADFNRDKYQCEMEAARAFPTQMVTTQTAGYQGPSTTNCSGKVNSYGGYSSGVDMNCTTSPGVNIPGVSTTNDANSFNRSHATESCLHSRGYSRIRVDSRSTTNLSSTNATQTIEPNEQQKQSLVIRDLRINKFKPINESGWDYAFKSDALRVDVARDSFLKVTNASGTMFGVLIARIKYTKDKSTSYFETTLKLEDCGKSSGRIAWFSEGQIFPHTRLYNNVSKNDYDVLVAGIICQYYAKQNQSMNNHQLQLAVV